MFVRCEGHECERDSPTYLVTYRVGRVFSRARATDDELLGVRKDLCCIWVDAAMTLRLTSYIYMEYPQSNSRITGASKRIACQYGRIDPC